MFVGVEQRPNSQTPDISVRLNFFRLASLFLAGNIGNDHIVFRGLDSLISPTTRVANH